MYSQLLLFPLSKCYAVIQLCIFLSYFGDYLNVYLYIINITLGYTVSSLYISTLYLFINKYLHTLGFVCPTYNF